MDLSKKQLDSINCGWYSPILFSVEDFPCIRHQCQYPHENPSTVPPESDLKEPWFAPPGSASRGSPGEATHTTRGSEAACAAAAPSRPDALSWYCMVHRHCM